MRARADVRQEILRGRILVRVQLQVKANAAPEAIWPGVLLEHADYGRTLLIGDAVERVGNVALRLNRLADAPRRHQAVEPHRIQPRVHTVDVRMPLRPPLVEHLVRHPGSERLVQPDIVPPLRRD